MWGTLAFLTGRGPRTESRRTEARRDRVTRLAARVTQLKDRLRVVYDCDM
jgi:hypothetical protein